jgi:hypothetical protein
MMIKQTTVIITRMAEKEAAEPGLLAFPINL